LQKDFLDAMHNNYCSVGARNAKTPTAENLPQMIQKRSRGVLMTLARTSNANAVVLRTYKLVAIVHARSYF